MKLGKHGKFKMTWQIHSFFSFCGGQFFFFSIHASTWTDFPFSINRMMFLEIKVNTQKLDCLLLKLPGRQCENVYNLFAQIQFVELPKIYCQTFSFLLFIFFPFKRYSIFLFRKAEFLRRMYSKWATLIKLTTMLLTFSSVYTFQRRGKAFQGIHL